MREAVIVTSSRTPLAKSCRGSFCPDDLAAHNIQPLPLPDRPGALETSELGESRAGRLRLRKLRIQR
jgi:hypothetical protein